MSESEVRQCKDISAPAHLDRAPEDPPAMQAGHPGLDEVPVSHPPSDMLVNIIAELLNGRSDAASILAAAAVRLARPRPRHSRLHRRAARQSARLSRDVSAEERDMHLGHPSAPSTRATDRHGAAPLCHAGLRTDRRRTGTYDALPCVRRLHVPPRPLRHGHGRRRGRPQVTRGKAGYRCQRRVRASLSHSTRTPIETCC